MDKDKAYVYFDVRNSKQFYKRLKMFGITYDELKRAVEDVK